MTRPQRIQLRRTRGWRMPSGAVKVDRTTLWGNPFRADQLGQAGAVEAFREFLSGDRQYVRDSRTVTYPADDEIRRRLGGRDLACWCRPAEPCHADALLKIANDRPVP